MESRTLLTLSDRRTHAPVQPDPATGRYPVQGERDWLLQGEVAAHLDAVVAAFPPGVAERLSGGLVLLRFGNAVGRVEVPHLGTLEVRSGKWGEADFEAMLADLMEIASALPFAADAATALPDDRSAASASPDVLYHAFVYLRHILSDAAPREERLLPALEAVLREPHRRFEGVTVTVPLEQAHRADEHTTVRLLSDPARLAPVVRGNIVGGAGRLTLALRGYLPSHVDERHTVVTADTPENRFVKAFLATAQGVIEGMRRSVSMSALGVGAPRFRARVLADCAAMERALLPAARHPLWHEVGATMHQLPGASTVLQRRRGYRDVFRHHARLRLAARVPLEKDTLGALLEAKDIALLYELWCFFAVARELTALLGPPAVAEGPRADVTQVVVEHDIGIRWPDGTCLSYNPRFSRSSRCCSPSRPRRSYSVPLRPDVALLVPGGPNQGLHLFDAKFRLDQINELLGEGSADSDPDGTEGEVEGGDDGVSLRQIEAEERRGTFKRADLYKMHTYRDALGAESVWVLYPGTEFRLFPAAGGAVVTAPNTLTSGGANQALRGVGGIAAAPSMPNQSALQMVLKSLSAINVSR